MHWLMLRGSWPKDRKNPKEILYNSLVEETDMWTHLMAAVARPQDTVTILYGGHRRDVKYNDRVQVLFLDSVFDYKGPKPHFLFARGGFPEWYKMAEKYDSATAIYYGAGKRYIPEAGKWHLILADSPEQRDRIQKKRPYANVQAFWKPASPQFYVQQPTEKKYDVCYVAVHPTDKRKRCEWVYDTCPRDVRILQLGDAPRSHPGNVTHKHMRREDMPAAMRSAKVGIAPYTGDDSGPRVIPEFNACGLPVIVSEEVPVWDIMYNMRRASDRDFWPIVIDTIHNPPHNAVWGGTIESAGERIRQLVLSLWEE